VAAGARANTSPHHDVGGGGGGDTECIRWEPIPVDMAARDMSAVDLGGGGLGNGDMGRVDMGRVDMGRADGGGAPVPMRCVEHASSSPGFCCARDAITGGQLGLSCIAAGCPVSNSSRRCITSCSRITFRRSRLPRLGATG